MLQLCSRLPQVVSRAPKTTPQHLSRSLFSTSANSLSPKSTPPPPHPIFSSTNSIKKTQLAPSSSTSDSHASSTLIFKTVRKQPQFDQLAPLQQIRQALSKPRPTSFPLLESSILDAAYKVTAGKSVDDSSIPPDFPFCSIKQLAFYGDRLWSEIVAGVLLAMRTRNDVRNKGKAGSLSGTSGFLVENKMAAKLTRQLGLAASYKIETLANEDHLADNWEAYLAALYLEKGREALLNFLVPIVGSENEILQERLLEMKEEKRKADTKNEIIVQEYAVALKKIQVEIVKQISQSLASRRSLEVPTSLLQEFEATTSSQAPLVKAQECVKEEERLRVLNLPKLKPLSFASLETARLEFRSKLESSKVPYLLTISPNHRRAELQLPGVPQIAVKISKATKNDEKVLTKLMKEVVGIGHFKLLKPVLPFSPFVFANIEKAQNNFLSQIAARKLKAVQGKSAGGRRRTLELPGCPPIVAEGKTKADCRHALVVRAVELGVIKLKSAAVPAP
ncbi:hypothetical protein JCM5350_003771 [Sporobolomyces pararoseus]